MKFSIYPHKIICITVIVCFCTAMSTGCSEISKNSSDTLVVACEKFTGLFNPLYATNTSDMAVCDVTHESLFNVDRNGEIVKLGIQGETKRYNNTDYTYKGIADCRVEYNGDGVDYHIKLREDVRFSDGEIMNVDDVIFTMYVMSDPSYTGIQQFASLPIIGMKAYTTNIGNETINRDESIYSECVDDAWDDCLRLIIEYCSSNYAELLDTFNGNEIALAMYGWGFATWNKDVGITGKATEKHWSLSGDDMPDIEDMFVESKKIYGGDAQAFYEESVKILSNKSILEIADEYYVEKQHIARNGKSQTITSISGIKKTGEFSLVIKMSEFNAVSMYALAFNVLPLHYYGDVDQYDCENGEFGFIKGDLSSIKSRNQKTLGAGPYSFCEYSDGVVKLKRNVHYYKGCPNIENILMREVNTNDVVDSLLTGIVDVATLNYDSADLDRIADANENGDISGNIIYTAKSDTRGYGYIGINADNVKVGKDKSSKESKALRCAFATVFSVYRDIAVSSYFDVSSGCLAKVIEYPVPPSSWASPRSTDEGYAIAFSVDPDGNKIYHQGMSEQQKYDKALETAKEFFIRAGYEYDDNLEKFVCAPSGASLTYTIVIPGGGTKAHPSYIIANYAASALSKIGITLELNDVSESNNMWSMLSRGECEMWSAAWGKGADPDLEQIYHSRNIPNKGGSDCNYYAIEDNNLDDLIESAKGTDDVSFRKKVYKSCFDTIMEWAVEIPVFTADTMTSFSADRIDVNTITSDITAFWNWRCEIEEIEMKQ